MFPDITSFISELERRKDLARISDAVSPNLEIAAVIDRACKSPGGGPGLVFERPTGFQMPVAANLFGSMSRICLALGVDTLDDLAREIDEMTTPPMPKGFVDALKMLPLVNRLTDLMVQHVVNHGSYHRGQVTTMLRQLGAQPPKSQDLITFYRERA